MVQMRTWQGRMLNKFAVARVFGSSPLVEAMRKTAMDLSGQRQPSRKERLALMAYDRAMQSRPARTGASADADRARRLKLLDLGIKAHQAGERDPARRLARLEARLTRRA